jgi:ribonuclease Z
LQQNLEPDNDPDNEPTGVLKRLYETGSDVKKVDTVFLTHLHNDHIEGLPNLFMAGFFIYRRSASMTFYGPVGTQQMLKGMTEMFAHDMTGIHGEIRPAGGGLPAALTYSAHETLADGVVYDKAGVTVTAFKVEHGDGNPAYGYRVDYKGRSVVLSGDTTYNDNLVAHSKNVDVLIHMILAIDDAKRAAMPAEVLARVEAKQSTPPQVARVLMQDNPKMAVLYHFNQSIVSSYDAVRAAGYQGPLTVSADRMTIDVSETVTVSPPPALVHAPGETIR